MSAVQPRQTIAVWFSCGAASACAAKLTIERYSDIATVRVLNTPVLEEGKDNQRFRNDVQEWLGVEVETVTNPKWPDNSAQSVWDKTRFMAGPMGARCTLELKKRSPLRMGKTQPCRLACAWVYTGRKPPFRAVYADRA